MSGEPKRYSPEFKEQAAKKVIDNSLPIAQVARELGVNDTTLGFWVKAYRKEIAGGSSSARDAGSGTGKGTAAPCPATWKMELGFSSEKAAAYFAKEHRWTEKYNFIDAEYATPAGDEAPAPTITQMCEWLEVSKSGYYEWRSRPQSETEKRREILKLKIRALFEANNEEYGYRRLHAALVRGGEQVGEELVRQLMRELELTPCQPRPWRVSLTEQGAAGPIPDLVNRDFSAEKPGEKMVGDITYIPTWEGWVYLALVIDCATRMITGWAMGDNYKTPLITKAIRMAARKRGTCRKERYSIRIAEAIIPRPSMPGCSKAWESSSLWDARESATIMPLAESVNGTVQGRAGPPHSVRDTPAKRWKDIARYIELRYNRTRLHSALGYRTPQEVMDELLENAGSRVNNRRIPCPEKRGGGPGAGAP
jgi:putative transposase